MLCAAVGVREPWRMRFGVLHGALLAKRAVAQRSLPPVKPFTATGLGVCGATTG
jgi:hypothetical protein